MFGAGTDALDCPVLSFSEKAQFWIFTPHFSEFWAFRTLHPSKRHVLWEVLLENKTFYFSKRALRKSTARSKWLK